MYATLVEKSNFSGFFAKEIELRTNCFLKFPAE